jgi:GNAT superfamily N-acetyltransferase
MSDVAVSSHTLGDLQLGAPSLGLTCEQLAKGCPGNASVTELHGTNSKEPTVGLKLVLCISHVPTRNAFLTALRGLKDSGKLGSSIPRYALETICVETREHGLGVLSDHLSVLADVVAILLFDLPSGLVKVERDVEANEASQWTERISSQMKSRCATVAIMRYPRRLNNIDRVIDPLAEPEKLLETLKLVVDRLAYTALPEKRSLAEPLEVRLIRRQHELLNYFKLRHRIYKIMGYLTEEIEHAPSQMEIGWCDTIALHIGGYKKVKQGQEILVGTARVVVGTVAEPSKRPPLLASYERWVRALASSDPVLRQELLRGVLPFQLPIFQSMKLHDVLREATKSGEVCGELSRVIVTEDYRGVGLSRRLVESALEEAAKVGVGRVFLECLDIHEKMYNKLGFKRVEGVSGTVLAVKQTMIAMELSRRLATSKVRTVSPNN